MNFKTARVHVVLTVVFLLFVGYSCFNRGTAVDVALVTSGPMVQSVVMSGRITTVPRNDVASQSTSRIESNLVREGDKVNAGLVLVRLHDDEATAALRQAKAAVAEARARLLEIRTVQSPPGDTAQPGKAIQTVVGGDETRIQGGVDEKNLRHLALGQQAAVIADAYPSPGPCRFPRG